MNSSCRPAKVKVTADGAGVVSHAGSLLLVEMAEAVGLRDSPSHAMAPTPQRRSATQSGSGCRPGDPLDNVYHPHRLEVRDRCKTVAGVVEQVKYEDYDGDWHIDLRLDPPYAGLVNEGNVSERGGDLLAEIAPADAPGCKPGYV